MLLFGFIGKNVEGSCMYKVDENMVQGIKSVILHVHILEKM